MAAWLQVQEADSNEKRAAAQAIEGWLSGCRQARKSSLENIQKANKEFIIDKAESMVPPLHRFYLHHCPSFKNSLKATRPHCEAKWEQLKKCLEEERVASERIHPISVFRDSRDLNQSMVTKDLIIDDLKFGIDIPDFLKRDSYIRNYFFAGKLDIPELADNWKERWLLCTLIAVENIGQPRAATAMVEIGVEHWLALVFSPIERHKHGITSSDKSRDHTPPHH